MLLNVIKPLYDWECSQWYLRVSLASTSYTKSLFIFVSRLFLNNETVVLCHLLICKCSQLAFLCSWGLPMDTLKPFQQNWVQFWLGFESAQTKTYLTLSRYFYLEDFIKVTRSIVIKRVESRQVCKQNLGFIPLLKEKQTIWTINHMSAFAR